jgi:hypothetical protein
MLTNQSYFCYINFDNFKDHFWHLISKMSKQILTQLQTSYGQDKLVETKNFKTLKNIKSFKVTDF